ncbi:hypothetical protein HYV80_06870 [Candidatus Woesearchaeota archaeon]|nr:hypothetical protein [Candidatus Woesearchaeota archaeon]
MKKMILFFLISFLAVPAVFADISITADQGIYNLGNKIKVSASILQAGSFDGLFKVVISCSNYRLEYFLTPVNLEANYRTAVNVPELAASSQMLGDCIISGQLATNDNSAAEEKSSNAFQVTRQLAVLPVNSRITAFPGDLILVAGIVNEAFGNNAPKASVKVTLDNNSHSIDALSGQFSQKIELPKKIKSGKHEILISSFDSKNNFGDASIELDVTAVPDYISLELDSSQLLPGEKTGIVASLFDQADDLINVSLELELAYQKGSNIFRKKSQSSEKMTYEFSQYAEPGLYTLTANYKDLSAQSFINITTIREVKIKYENETVFIENIGNVPFEDELTFILESELKKYPITKKISVEPSKILNIDLSKEVPLGVYNILAPLKEGMASGESSNETLERMKFVQQEIIDSKPDHQSVLASEVTIHDNRPAYKKIASSLSSISGSLVGADGILTKNPLMAPMILVIMLMLVAFRYGRKPIMNFIKGKKEEEKEKQA